MTADPLLPRRAEIERALQEARVAAYPAGEYIGQEGFMRASDIEALAARAGVAGGVSVMDLCCGSGGPGRHLVQTLGCRCVGVDASAEMVMRARTQAVGLDARYLVATVPPVPNQACEVVLLLETMLAFPDKRTLLGSIASALPRGGRFACTVEEGAALRAPEQAAMPHADTVWPVEWAELVRLLGEVGLHVTWRSDDTAAHREVVDTLISSLTARRDSIVAALGPRFLDDLLAAHRLWRAWLESGRIRKFSVVAEK